MQNLRIDAQALNPGTAATRPAAGAENLGYLYYATDEEAAYLSVRTGPSSYAWMNVSGRAIKRYRPTDAGWTAQNGNGSATVAGGGLRVALATAESAGDSYPSSSAPRHYRDISADIEGYENFTIWFQVLSASLAGADQLLGISLCDATEATGTGACALTSAALQLTAVPFLNGEYVGAPVGVVSLDGLGYLGISRRGGTWSSLAGIGTATAPPTSYASCRIGVGGSTGQPKPTRLSAYLQKFGGTDMNAVFGDVIIHKFAY